MPNEEAYTFGGGMEGGQVAPTPPENKEEETVDESTDETVVENATDEGNEDKGEDTAPKEKEDAPQEEETEDEAQSTELDLSQYEGRKPANVEASLWENASTEERIIYNSLDDIVAYGKDGSQYTVRIPDQLPDDFEFATPKGERNFMLAMNANQAKAQEMESKINQMKSHHEATQAETNFATQTVNEIAKLQKEGLLPTPKVKPDSADFAKDEAVVEIDKVLGFWAEKQKAGSKMSIADATELYYLKNPKKTEEPEAEEEKKPNADAERKAINQIISGKPKVEAKKETTKKSAPVGFDVGALYEKYLGDDEDDF
jgi:hypothetical protein